MGTKSTIMTRKKRTTASVNDTGTKFDKPLVDHSSCLARIFPTLYICNPIDCRQTGAKKCYSKIISYRVDDCSSISDCPLFQRRCLFTHIILPFFSIISKTRIFYMSDPNYIVTPYCFRSTNNIFCCFSHYF